ncbi:MAG: hypothetical protein ACTSSG_11570 [Candidatus Heimdallarchaeaceae archaeon]
MQKVLTEAKEEVEEYHRYFDILEKKIEEVYDIEYNAWEVLNLV